MTFLEAIKMYHADSTSISPAVLKEFYKLLNKDLKRAQKLSIAGDKGAPSKHMLIAMHYITTAFAHAHLDQMTDSKYWYNGYVEAVKNA